MAAVHRERYNEAPASKAVHGGFSARRSPDAYRAPRWTAEAAAYAQAALEDEGRARSICTSTADPRTVVARMLRMALSDAEALDGVLARLRRAVTERVASIAEAILRHGAGRIRNGDDATRVATGARELMRFHAGGAGAMRDVQLVAGQPAEATRSGTKRHARHSA